MSTVVIVSALWVIIEVFVVVGLIAYRTRFKRFIPWAMCVFTNILALVFNVVTLAIQP